VQFDRRGVIRIANDRYHLPGANVLTSRDQLWQEQLADAFTDVHRMDIDGVQRESIGIPGTVLSGVGIT
jgi:hypothetical protein